MPRTVRWIAYRLGLQFTIRRGGRPRKTQTISDVPFLSFERRMLVLAGAIKDVPQSFSETASRFAAQSESFAKLTEEERKILDEFVGFLRNDK